MTKLLKMNASPLEVTVFIIFVLYLIVQMDTPLVLANMINNPIGMLVVVIVSVYLLLNTHPILGIFSVIVAYELIRRSSLKKVKHVRFEEPSQSTKDSRMKKMNPPKSRSLEEEIVEKMTPSNKKVDYYTSTFNPVSEDIHSALLLR
tara:strand:+ start:131 stop:571 length:441 start_codon:yes stop_codon:yes gene_type:complete